MAMGWWVVGSWGGAGCSHCLAGPLAQVFFVVATFTRLRVLRLRLRYTPCALPRLRAFARVRYTCSLWTRNSQHNLARGIRARCPGHTIRHACVVRVGRNALVVTAVGLGGGGRRGHGPTVE